MKLQKLKNTHSFKIIQNKNIIGLYIVSKQKKFSKLLYKTFILKKNLNITDNKKNMSKGFIKKVKKFFF